jgi:hypothetical protein
LRMESKLMFYNFQCRPQLFMKTCGYQRRTQISISAITV